MTEHERNNGCHSVFLSHVQHPLVISHYILVHKDISSGSASITLTYFLSFFLPGTVLFQPASLYSVLLLYRRYKLIPATFSHSCGSPTTLERQIADQHTTSVTPVPFIEVWLRYHCRRLSTCFLNTKLWQCKGWIIFLGMWLHLQFHQQYSCQWEIIIISSFKITYSIFSTETC